LHFVAAECRGYQSLIRELNKIKLTHALCLSARKKWTPNFHFLNISYVMQNRSSPGLGAPGCLTSHF